MLAKIKDKSIIIEWYGPTRCYKCDAPVYIKPVQVDWDWKVKQIPYCYYSGQRHYCIGLEQELIQKSTKLETS